MSEIGLPQIVEAALLAAGKPLTVVQLADLFEEHERPDNKDLREALKEVGERCNDRGFELQEVASGFRFQVRQEMSTWVARLWHERPQRYSRAMLETLALIAYRQPITRGEIEEIRGVAVSSNIIKTLHEREWIRVVGHRDVPGRPAMYATTRQFLDYFSLKSLEQLPALAEIRDFDTLNTELGFTDPLPESLRAEMEGETVEADSEESGDAEVSLQELAEAAPRDTAEESVSEEDEEEAETVVGQESEEPDIEVVAEAEIEAAAEDEAPAVEEDKDEAR